MTSEELQTLGITMMAIGMLVMVTGLLMEIIRISDGKDNEDIMKK